MYVLPPCLNDPRRDGIQGCFRGMTVKLWQTVLTAAFQFLAYEKISGFIFSLLSDQTMPLKKK